MDQFAVVAKAIGLDPALVTIGIVLAILLRYARGMVKWMGSGATYGTALATGLIGSGIECAQDGNWHTFGGGALALAAFILISQKVLEGLANVVPWLPQDNEWVAKSKPAAPPQTSTPNP